MKTKGFIACVTAMLTLLAMNSALGQWSYNGTHIYNTNTGYVGIGNNSPARLLYVGRNMTEPTVAIRNFGGTGGATFEMIDNASGADWKFKATLSGGFKIRDHTNGLDVMIFEPNSIANAIYVNTLGKVGLRNAAPSAFFHVAHATGHTGAFGQDISSFSSGANVSIGDAAHDAVLYAGQSSARKGFFDWIYHADPDDSYLAAGTFDGLNPLILQPVGGKVCVGQKTTPSALLEVYFNSDSYAWMGYNSWTGSYFYHREHQADGDGQNAVYALRTRDSQNDGTSYGMYWSNTASVGICLWGDLYSFGTAGFSDLDFNRCGGTLGASANGTTWGSLGYKTSGNIYYGGYFSSYSSGGGKGSQQPKIGIGMGAWGDLMGADIHGKIYGAYLEGGNYALFTNGLQYTNNLDVHLQERPDGTNSVMYTNVSTDVTVMTSGTAMLSGGSATISFDPAFSCIVSANAPVVVTVTPVGDCNGVHLSSVTNKGITVVENSNGRSSVTVNYIAIGRRAGYEKPALAPEVIDPDYTTNLARGLHADADTQTDGEGLYYENGQLVVGIHPSTLPDPNKQEKAITVPKTTGSKTVRTNSSMGSRIGE